MFLCVYVLLPGKSERSFWTGQRRVNRFRRIGISQIGRLNPAGINAPVKKMVESIAQVGNQEEKKRSDAACVPGELQRPSKDLKICGYE